MEKYRAIPQGYMTVGEIAKKMGVTVRTLQYYDKEGILPPSTASIGGRRLYTHKDIVKLHQIQSMKYLGFNLEDIKTRLPSIDSPEEVASVLSQQADVIREKINSLTNVLESIEKLNMELLKMKAVDWEKYADILILLQAKNDLYWAIKHFDDKVLNHIRTFDKDSCEAIMNAQKLILKKASELQKKGVSHESEQAQALAKNYWDTVMEFTKGDMSLLPELIRLAEKRDDSECKSKQEFIEKALGIYMENLGYVSFEFEGGKTT